MRYASYDIETIELPDEVLELLPEADRLSAKVLDAVAGVILDRRQLAIDSRLQRGIDANFTRCEEGYHGIDDMNRGEMSGNQWVQPHVMNAPLTQVKDHEKTSKKSSAFVRVTARYVDAGAAKISEILLSTDDKAFGFSATPVPTFIDALQDQSVMKDPQTGNAMERFRFPGETNPPQAVGTSDGQPTYALKASDVAEEHINRAEIAAKKAETQVHDWMVECHHTAEMRKVIFDAARLGVGVLKGPYPEIRRGYAVMKKPGLSPGAPSSLAVVMKTTVSPADKWVNPWNIFPDPACGDNIRNGSYVFEREYLSEKGVRDLMGVKGYIRRQIEKALTIGPTTAMKDTNPNKDKTVLQYELWHFYGTISRKELAAINPKAAKAVAKDRPIVSVQMTVIEDTVIRVILNPLEVSGDLPYMSIPWQPRAGSWVGTGVAEQLRVPQEITNASTRALLNNAGISAGPQIVIAQGLISPADGDWEIVPNKVWYLKDDGTMDDVRKAFVSFQITNIGDQIMKIVEYGMRLAEEVSSIPLVTQGMSGKTTPETYGATQLQDNNANQLLRSIAATFDVYITEPLVMGYYEWYLLDENIPAENKAEFVVHATGSAALVEQAIQDRSYIDLLPILQNPQYGFNPKKVGRMIAKSRRLPVQDLMYTKEEQEKIDSQPPTPAPAVQVAQIKAEIEKMKMQMEANVDAAANASAERIAQIETEADKEIAQMREQTAQLRIKMDTDRDNVYVQTQLQTAQTVYESKLKELQLKKDLATAEFAMQQKISVDQAKTKLADTAMKLRVQKEMEMVHAHTELRKHGMKEAMKPPIQTVGRAKDAFSQI